MLEQDQPYLAQKRYLRRDGATVDVIVASTAVRDSDGHPVALFTQVEDITDREQAEQEGGGCEPSCSTLLTMR